MFSTNKARNVLLKPSSLPEFLAGKKYCAVGSRYILVKIYFLNVLTCRKIARESFSFSSELKPLIASSDTENGQ